MVDLPRCKLVPGDFFDEVPSGGDVYILKRVLFDWTDEEALRILKNCRQAMNIGARLLIIEPLIGPPNEQCPAHLFDMTFLVMLHGRLQHRINTRVCGVRQDFGCNGLCRQIPMSRSGSFRNVALGRKNGNVQ